MVFDEYFSCESAYLHPNMNCASAIVDDDTSEQ